MTSFSLILRRAFHCKVLIFICGIATLANFTCDEQQLLGSLASCSRLVELYLHSLTESCSEDTTNEYDIKDIRTTATVSARLRLLKHLTVRACSGITDVWAYGMDDLTSLESITFTRHSHNGMKKRGKQHLLEKAPHVQKLDWKAGDAEDIPGIQVSLNIHRWRLRRTRS
ncbi:hypothetical protein BCR43DRAFT_518921 [Syncephalastrum racemosum]|uniref:F-box domain-containing protein n=1 Tax=Syncephalastrum racemosum TaxID=13706 RepID=A0A1X2H073_SYNRA|nr:hypothetical protein BCR43DRAFT_518921 [Syncephalastrum racemosum]